MAANGTVSIAQLAREWGVNNKTASAFVERLGIPTEWSRDANNRPTRVIVNPEDAAHVRSVRRSRGFAIPEEMLPDTTWVYFYVVQVAPDLKPTRIKLGIAANVENRLDIFRNLSPTATLVRSWQTRAGWERAAIDSLTRVDAIQLGPEVFDVVDLNALLSRADGFFELMPPGPPGPQGPQGDLP